MKSNQLTMTTEKRSDGSNESVIKGRAIVFDEFQEARDYWGDTFYEQISSSVRNNLKTKDIFLLYNHNYDNVIGRESVNVDITVSENGLDFEWRVPSTQMAQDVAQMVRSGMVQGCSFGFIINDQKWEERDGDYFRTISDIELHEITITPIPFYKSTYVRSDVKLRDEQLKNGDEVIVDNTPEEDVIDEPSLPQEEIVVNELGLTEEESEALSKVSTERMVSILRNKFGDDKDISEHIKYYTNLKLQNSLGGLI